MTLIGAVPEETWAPPLFYNMELACLFVAAFPYSQYTHAEHYQAAVMPAQVKKPKEKASVEGAVGKIARKIIGMLRNGTFHSIDGLNPAIRKTLDRLNDKPFQKRNGSRKTIYELEEKPYLRTLPMFPFESCEWLYNHKVGPNSHIWFHKRQYSVPSSYINTLMCSITVLLFVSTPHIN
ncbi:MAG: hypothetical protein HFG65_03450 [Hungatella sp.]|nr:hypothetical protein [Hungatella sp.]